MIWIQQTIKRGLDFLVSLVGLAILALPFLIISAMIKRDSPGAVFFRQERVGKSGRLFRVWKFRTMVTDAIHKGLGVTISKDDLRITKVGRILRDWGLDELPQLINVLMGDMSLVGPRPTLVYQVDHYNDFQHRRLEVKPGITSLAVVSGRNALPWVERIELDIWYIDHWSLRLDLSILFRPLWKVLVTREGLYGADGVNDPYVEQSHSTDGEGDAR